MKEITLINISIWRKDSEEYAKLYNIIFNLKGKKPLVFLDNEDEIKKLFMAIKENRSTIRDRIKSLHDEVFKDQRSENNKVPTLHIHNEYPTFHHYYRLDAKFFESEMIIMKKLMFELDGALEDSQNLSNILNNIKNAVETQMSTCEEILFHFANGFQGKTVDEPPWRTSSKDKGYENPNDDRRVLKIKLDTAPIPNTIQINIDDDEDEDEDEDENEDEEDDDLATPPQTNRSSINMRTQNTGKRSRSKSPGTSVRKQSTKDKTDVQNKGIQDIPSQESSTIYLKINEDSAIAANDLKHVYKKDKHGKFIGTVDKSFKTFDDIFGKDSYNEIIHDVNPDMDYWYKHGKNHVRITELQKVFGMEIFEEVNRAYGMKLSTDDNDLASMAIYKQSRADFEKGEIKIFAQRKPP